MVRHKTRFLLICLDFPGQLSPIRPNIQHFPSRRDFLKAMEESITNCFGLSSSLAAVDAQVRLCDPKTGLVLVRVSRANYALIRASLTMMTSIGVTPLDPSGGGVNPMLGQFGRNQQQQQAVVARVVSVHGSIRTAKIATMQQIRKQYRPYLESVEEREINRGLRSLEECLTLVQGLE